MPRNRDRIERLANAIAARSLPPDRRIPVQVELHAIAEDVRAAPVERLDAIVLAAVVAGELGADRAASIIAGEGA